MVSSNDVTITEALAIALAESNDRAFYEYPYSEHDRAEYRAKARALMPALRSHFAAERMPEDVQKLVEDLKRKRDDLAYDHPHEEESETMALLREAAAALEAAYSQKGTATVCPEQYAIRFRPPGRSVWRYVEYPDLRTAVEEFEDYAEETHPQMVKREAPEAWREVSMNEAQERFSFAHDVTEGLAAIMEGSVDDPR